MEIFRDINVATHKPLVNIIFHNGFEILHIITPNATLLDTTDFI